MAVRLRWYHGIARSLQCIDIVIDEHIAWKLEIELETVGFFHGDSNNKLCQSKKYSGWRGLIFIIGRGQSSEYSNFLFFFLIFTKKHAASVFWLKPSTVMVFLNMLAQNEYLYIWKWTPQQTTVKTSLYLPIHASYNLHTFFKIFSQLEN